MIHKANTRELRNDTQSKHARTVEYLFVHWLFDIRKTRERATNQFICSILLIFGALL